MGIRDELDIRGEINPHHEAVLNVLVTANRLLGTIEETLKNLDLTEPQFNVLSVLFSQIGQPISVSEIQKRMIQRQSNVTRIVDRLVDKGWVRRRTCPENRRKVDLTITEGGREVFRNARRRISAFHQALEQRIGGEEAQRLCTLLERFRTAENSPFDNEREASRS